VPGTGPLALPENETVPVGGMLVLMLVTVAVRVSGDPAAMLVEDACKLSIGARVLDLQGDSWGGRGRIIGITTVDGVEGIRPACRKCRGQVID